MSNIAEDADLTFIVTRGRDAGVVLTPHKHADGAFVVSRARFKVDYVRV